MTKRKSRAENLAREIHTDRNRLVSDLSRDERLRLQQWAVKILSDGQAIRGNKLQVRRETWESWRSGARQAQPRALEELIGAALQISDKSDTDETESIGDPKSGAPAGKWRRGFYTAKQLDRLTAEGLYPGAKLQATVRRLMKYGEMSHADMEDAIDVDRKLLNTILAGARVSPLDAERIKRLRVLLEAMRQGRPLPNATHRFMAAARALVPNWFWRRASLAGKGQGDGSINVVVEDVAARTGFSMRHVRRYLPPFAKDFKASRAVMLAFEYAARSKAEKNG